MKNDLSGNRRDLTADVDLWPLRRNENQNYPEIDSAFAMPKVYKYYPTFYHFQYFNWLISPKNPNLMCPLWRVILEGNLKELHD